MKRLLICLSLCSGAAQAITVVDDSGHRITLQQPARRIVSLAPHNTENLFSAGAGQQVVGVVSWSDFPSAARHIPQVGDAMNLNMEAILALQPDLVVAWQSGNPPAVIERLRSLGVAVFVSEPSDFAGVIRNIEALGQLSGHEDEAARETGRLQLDFERFRSRYSGRQHVRYFLQVSDVPLYSLGGRHLISRMLAICGGENILDDSAVLAPQVSVESVLQASPEVIVMLVDNEERARWLQQWERWAALPAVHDRRVLAFDNDALHRPVARLLPAVEEVCEGLQVMSGVDLTSDE